MADRNGLQLDLFGHHERVAVAPGGTIVRPQLTRGSRPHHHHHQRARVAGQLNLPFHDDQDAGDRAYRRSHYGYSLDQ
jgi:hypothetical protein